MKLLLKWVRKHKRWLFSGIGVVIPISIAAFLWNRRSFLWNHLTSQISIPYFLFYILIVFSILSLFLIILKLKKILLPHKYIEQDITKRHHMLGCELQRIPENVRLLVDSILGLPYIFDFLESNKFDGPRFRHDISEEWHLIRDIIRIKSNYISHTGDIFSNLINELYPIEKGFLQKFLGDFLKRYKEEYPKVDIRQIGQIESKLESLENVSQPKPKEKVREELTKKLKEISTVRVGFR